MKDKKDMSEMSESEVSFRKFLKKLGVTTHQELENIIKLKIDKGELIDKKQHDFGNYLNDYTLQRAIDLVKGISLYNEQNKQKDE